MLVINYNGGKPTTDYYKFSVQGNNNADVIRFLISLNQSGLVLNKNYHYYAKVQCIDDDYYDKVRLTNVEFDNVNNLIKADFILQAQQTSHKQIEVSLSCENYNNEVVWQTQIVKIAIANGVNADEEIEEQYPSVLQDLQRQIDEGGGGGGSGYKTIMLEVLPSIVDWNYEIVFRGSLRLKLVNFTSSDVGSYIYLYNYSLGTKRKNKVSGFRQRPKMTFKHPANYDSDETNIQKLGYGVLANKNYGRGDTWDSVPPFMFNNGFVQTEYEITEQHINQGYMDIDIGREFLQLLIPNTRDGSNLVDGKWGFYNSVSIIGQNQFITFYQVKNNKVVCYPKNIIKVWARGGVYEIQDEYSEEEETRLTQKFNINLLAY